MAADLTRLVRILRTIEEVSAEGPGAIDFSVGSDFIARVMAENGRVCWAAARSQAPTISEIFAEECDMSRAELEEAFQEASASRIPFGEALVAKGLIDEDLLRRSLRRQMVVSLSTLSASWPSDESASWSAVETPGLSYDPSFTMSPMELLFSCIAHSPHLTQAVGEIPLSFSKLAPKLSSAICLRETNCEDLPFVPVASANMRETSLDAVLAITQDALSVVRPVALAEASIRPYGVLVHLNGEGIVCTFERPFLCVFEIRERSQYGELMAHLLNEPRCEGVYE